MTVLPDVSKGMLKRVLAPSPQKEVREILKGTRIPVGKGGELRIVFFDHEMPVGELRAAPFHVRFTVETLVTYGTWWLVDVRGDPVEVKGAYHYCIRGFKCALPTELLESLYSGRITPLDPKAKDRILRGLKKYQEVEPWLTAKRDTPLMRSLLSLRASRERNFSSLERYAQAFTSFS